jgi:hypothetical protein
MPNVTATIRFGSRAVGRAFRLTAGSSVDVTAEFRDDDGALVDVSGVTLTATRPGGTRRRRCRRARRPRASAQAAAVPAIPPPTTATCLPLNRGPSQCGQ